MKFMLSALFLFASADAFQVQLGPNPRLGSCGPLCMSKVGIYFGTSTGSTQEVADLIKEEFGDDAEGPFDVDSDPIIKSLENYDTVVVGTPTWNTGADTQRSGTGWDELYSEMEGLDLSGKKVAVFGLGDQVSYAENYADATGELHDVFESLGCKMYGYTSQEGYEHEDSKSIRGDKFCGLLCDMVNQEELTEERVKNWVAQLREEGFLEGGGETSTVPAAEAAPAPVATSDASSEDIVAKLERENAELRAALSQKKESDSLSQLEENSSLLDRSIASHDTGYTPHYNPVSGKTMWTSSDGRTCYYTADTTAPQTTKMSP